MGKMSAHDGLMGVLDVGTSKVVCLIARRQLDSSYKVIGVGNWACTGVVEGQVSDMDATEKAIRQSVEQAEKMAGERLDRFTLAVQCGQPCSETVDADCELFSETVTEDDVNSVLSKAINSAKIPEGFEILHAIPAAFMLDGSYSTKAPLGMFGKRLNVVVHLVLVASAPLRNLELCVKRAGMGVDRVIAASFASGLSTLHKEEREIGAACIDMGGGTTTVSIFTQGKIVHTEVLPIGFHALSETIARELITPVDKAERLKNAQGGAIRETIDDRVEIDVPVIGGRDDDSDARRMPRSALTYLMQNHYDYVLREVRLCLDSIGFSDSPARRVVLTGGAAQAENLERLAADILGKDVRIAQPSLIAGLPLSAQNPIFACSAGLLVYNESDQTDIVDKIVSTGQNRRLKKEAPQGMLGKIGAWIKGSF